MGKKTKKRIESLSVRFTEWIGTPTSIVIHSIFFVGIFTLILFGVNIEDILLILTTAVSLEAIYLAIFIQMTVNRNTKALEAVEEDIEDIQEDVEDLEEEVEDISEDIDEDENIDKATNAALSQINQDLKKLQEDLAQLVGKSQK